MVSMFFVLFLHSSGLGPCFKLVEVFPSTTSQNFDSMGISFRFLVLVIKVWFQGTSKCGFNRYSTLSYILVHPSNNTLFSSISSIYWDLVGIFDMGFRHFWLRGSLSERKISL